MDSQTYDTLWHYSEQFTRDKLQRSELVTMAWKQGLKLGERCNINLMQSVMHFRAKEIKIRSAFPTDEVGKSKQDIWNKCYKVEVGAGHELSTARGTVWGAYQAATELIDHVKTSRTGDDGRLQSMWFGTGERFKVKAFEMAKELVRN